MRLFQFNTYYLPYLEYFNAAHPHCRDSTYAARLDALLEDRYWAPVVLWPVYQRDPEVRYTVTNDRTLQWKWADEHHFRSRDLKQILLAQIEDHRAEVIYSQNPRVFNAAWLRRLPGCVRRRVCYTSSPTPCGVFSAYHLWLSSHWPYVQSWRAAGIRSACLMPSHDPYCRQLAANGERPVDIAFAGSYRPEVYARRNGVLAALTALTARHRVELRPFSPKWKSLNIRGLRRFGIPGFHYLPPEVRAISGPPVFGRDMYELFGRSRIVFNAAVDASGIYRSNIRCFEALGCGACLLTDEGIYPPGLEPGRDFVTYRDGADAVAKLEALLAQPEQARNYGLRGSASLAAHYSKPAQWERFQNLVSQL